MSSSYLLILSYDGTRYFGWQKTKTGPSIQESLEQAIARITQEQVLPEAASRTDRGVHAEGQVASFTLQKTWDPPRLQQALNGVLPFDIRVRQIKLVPASFHPTLQAKEKEYHYRVCLGEVQEPNWRHYSWHYRYPLNPLAMEQAASALLGLKDFQVFANEPEENPYCTLSLITYTPLERQRLQISLKGDRFLYKMARNLVGTLLYIGSGKLPSSCIQSKDKKKIGMTAPAHGLFLHRVEY